MVVNEPVFVVKELIVEYEVVLIVIVATSLS